MSAYDNVPTQFAEGSSEQQGMERFYALLSELREAMAPPEIVVLHPLVLRRAEQRAVHV